MLVMNVITDEMYEKLIEYASKRCDAVMLTFCKSPFRGDDILVLNETKNNVKKQFKNSILKTRNCDYSIFSGISIHLPSREDNVSEVQFYKFDDSLKEYLLTKKNFYSWCNPKFPEDVTFFKDGYCWLYTITHEEMCVIYCSDKKEYEEMKNMGIKFYEKDFELIPKEKIYFEKY